MKTVNSVNGIAIPRKFHSAEEECAFEVIANFPPKLLWEESLKPQIDCKKRRGRLRYRVAVFALVADVPGMTPQDKNWVAERLLENSPLYKCVLQDIVKFAPSQEIQIRAQICLDTHRYTSP